MGAFFSENYTARRKNLQNKNATRNKYIQLYNETNIL